jgi:hypothetical protein
LGQGIGSKRENTKEVDERIFDLIKYLMRPSSCLQKKKRVLEITMDT